MGFRLTTSLKTKEIFEEMGSKMNLKPFALSKLAITLSLTNDKSIDDYSNATDKDTGLELHDDTITGKYASIYKVLIEDHAKENLSNEEELKRHMKLHIDRGAEMLKNKYAYSTNLENFISQIIKGDMGL